jgi:hypothetical protein
MVPGPCWLDSGSNPPHHNRRLARKLLIAIWRFVTLGLAPEGAIIAA